MKRAFKQKVKSVPSGVANNEALSESYSEENPPGDAAGSLRQSSIEVRRTRTSAATIGLAISIGVSSLLLPGQGDEVMAAEPVTSEATTATVPAALEHASVNSSSVVKLEPEAAVVSSAKKLALEAKGTTMSPTVESQPLVASTPTLPVIEHEVKSGQTLWQVSQKYQVDAAAIAASNENVPSTVLPSGKVLKVPSVNGIVREVKPGDTVETVSKSYGIDPTQLKLSSGTTASGSLPVGELVTVPGNVNNLLKAKQDNALSNLKEQRDRLQVSLAELGSEESKNTSERLQVQGSSAIAEGSKTAVVPPAVEAEMPIVTAPQQLVTVPSPEMKSGSSPVTPMAPGWVVAPRVATTPTPGMKSASPVTPGWVVAPKAVTIHTPEVVDQGKTPSSASQKLVEPQVPQTGNLYEVMPGDTLDAIAQSHGVSRSELLRVNHIDNPNVIHVSQKLIVPPQTSFPLSSSINPTSRSKAQELPRAIVATPSLTIPNLSTAVVLPATPKEPVSSSKIAATNATVSSPIVGIGVPIPTVLITKEVRQSPKSNLDSETNPYVGKLRDEIFKLREQYRTQREGSQAKPVANIAVPTVKLSVPASAPNNLPAPPPSQYINPEFSPKQYNEALQRENQKQPQKQTLQQGPIQIKVPAPDTPGKGTRQPLVATSAVGADTYNPTMQIPIGRPVSPELPPINAPDDFLPNSTRPFQGYIWPTKGVLTSGYGWRWGRMHRGVDIAAPVGTPVMAAAPGVVVYARWNAGGYGNLVDIQHPDGSLTRYGHNNKLLVREGQQVDQGQQIAEMGSTGYSTGPHCHFEVHPSGKGAVNPIAYLPRR